MINFQLKNLLKKKGVSQVELSQMTGIRQPTISAICNNQIKELPINVLDKICLAIDCNPGEIMEIIPVEKTEEKRSQMSKQYAVPHMTKEERMKAVQDALAISALDAPEPTEATKELLKQYVNGEKSNDEILQMTIQRYM